MRADAAVPVRFRERQLLDMNWLRSPRIFERQEVGHTLDVTFKVAEGRDELTEVLELSCAVPGQGVRSHPPISPGSLPTGEMT